MFNKNKRIVTLEELKAYRQSLVGQKESQLKTSETADTSMSQQRGIVKTLGINPSAGLHSYMPQSEINNDYISNKAGFVNGLILAGITFVIEIAFIVISYFIFK